MRLDGRVALITGGGSGIGEAAAVRYAREGAAVTVVDRNGEAANRVAAAIKAAGGRALAIQADVTSIPAVEKAVADTAAAFGGLHILLPSAGVFQPAPIEETTEELWDKCLDLDLRAVFFTIRAATPIMKRQKYGRIITISSIAGIVGFLNSPAYCAAKGGITNLTRAIACELAEHGITCNSIGPGPVETPINDQFKWRTAEGDAHRRWLADRTPSKVSYYKVEDMLSTLVFLAEETSGAVTGTIIPIDGGWTAW